MSWLKAALLLCVLSAPARADGPGPQYPDWVVKGSGAFGGEGSSKVFYGVGSAMAQAGTDTSEPAGWSAYFRALAEVAKVFNVYTAQLNKAYAAASSTSDDSATPYSKTFEEHAFGGVELKRLDKSFQESLADGGTNQIVNSMLKLTWTKGDQGFVYKDFMESRITGDQATEEQTILFTQSRGTADLLAELRGAGVELAAVWTDPTSATVYALARFDLEAFTKALEKSGKAGKPMSKKEKEKLKKVADKVFQDLQSEESK